MTATSVDVTARQQALDDALRYAERAAGLEAESSAAKAELAELQAISPVSLLDDTDGDLRRQIASRRPQLETTIELNMTAIAEARRRELAARQAALRAEAEEVEPELDSARSAVAAHDAKTQKLLDALERHTGARYRQLSLKVQQEEYEAEWGSIVGFHYRPNEGERLRHTVRRLERRQQILRAVADGHDPAMVIDTRDERAFDDPITRSELPPSVYGPSPVLPAPGWSRHEWDDSPEERADSLLARLAPLDDAIERAQAWWNREIHQMQRGKVRDYGEVADVTSADVEQALERWRAAVVARNNAVIGMRNCPPAVRAIVGDALEDIAWPTGEIPRKTGPSDQGDDDAQTDDPGETGDAA